MEIIKIFIASSEELKMERGEFSDIINDLNRAIKSLDLKFCPVKWEYLDGSMGILHKQEEYNAEIRKCNICLVMFWNLFGEYTEQELKIAYEAKRDGCIMQEVWLFCKEPAKEEQGLIEFKSRYFEKYGQQYVVFDNKESFRYKIICHIAHYLEKQKLTLGSILKVENSRISINGMKISTS